ncbi:hypothetical protein ACGFIW_01370 [Micromonospora sp. NPDC048935]|uniref:hypothetical protein n=1 Tax=Micromonospora sp. NPDC048935 TaxID=3364262 RepID=UPI00371974BF
MTAPTTATAAFDPMSQPCPDWCVQDSCPDPGVVDHYSREWAGRDYMDGAEWRVQVVQTVTVAGPNLAYINVNRATGSYASTAEFTRALMQAEVLKNRINADRAAALNRAGGAQ